MSNKNPGPQPQQKEKQIPTNVVPLTAHKCQAETCKAKPARAGFCDEHYMWFKEGLITLEGYKAKDFEKKYHNFMRNKQTA